MFSIFDLKILNYLRRLKSALSKILSIDDKFNLYTYIPNDDKQNIPFSKLKVGTSQSN